MNFPTDPYRIQSRVRNIDPESYGRTRNHTNGAVTKLSPYISRGVVSTKSVLDSLVHRGFTFDECETLVRELTWRDYFQRVWQQRDLQAELQHSEPNINNGIPSALVEAKVGIDAVDDAIRELYSTGYMHNHCRMYTASIACNTADAHWLLPAQWMYYHLLDGDWGCNACSWQWVAGVFSSKKYFANQENIDRYCGTSQPGSWLDTDYENLPKISCPDHLRSSSSRKWVTNLPEFPMPELDPNLPVCVYNYYNLDPEWRAEIPYNRVLLLEPEIFSQYAVSDNCLDFMFALAGNIPGLMFFTGTFDELAASTDRTIFFKEHPLSRHYRGFQDKRDWMVPEVEGFFPSFSSYWKKVERHLREAFRINALIRA